MCTRIQSARPPVFLLCLLLLPTLGWAFTSSQLNTELTTDPVAVGYASPLAAGNDAALVTAINLVRSGSGYVVSKGTVTRDQFIGSWIDVISLIPSHTDATIKAKWTWLLQNGLLATSAINYDDPNAVSFFGQMVSDGLLEMTGGGPAAITSDSVTARTTRQGSRAEVLWGSGTVVTLRDVSLALRSSQ